MRTAATSIFLPFGYPSSIGGHFLKASFQKVFHKILIPIYKILVCVTHADVNFLTLLFLFRVLNIWFWYNFRAMFFMFFATKFCFFFILIPTISFFIDFKDFFFGLPFFFSPLCMYFECRGPLCSPLLLPAKKGTIFFDYNYDYHALHR